MCRIYVHRLLSVKPTILFVFLPRDAMHKRGLCRHAVFVRLSEFPSTTFMYSDETNKHVFKHFSPSGSHATLVFFRTKRYGNILTESLTAVSNANGVGKKSRFSANICIHRVIACCQLFDRQVLYAQLRRTVAIKLVTLVAGCSINRNGPVFLDTL